MSPFLKVWPLGQEETWDVRSQLPPGAPTVWSTAATVPARTAIAATAMKDFNAAMEELRKGLAEEEEVKGDNVKLAMGVALYL